MKQRTYNIRSLTSLFSTAFVQVFFVALSTYTISNNLVIGIFISGYTISYIWTGNVKRISTSTAVERHIYSLGAALGSLSGYFFGKLILN